MEQKNWFLQNGNSEIGMDILKIEFFHCKIIFNPIFSKGKYWNSMYNETYRINFTDRKF